MAVAILFYSLTMVTHADALQRLHAGMRTLDVPTPHFTDRVEQAQQLVASRDHTPALAAADRELLGDTLRSLNFRTGASSAQSGSARSEQRAIRAA